MPCLCLMNTNLGCMSCVWQYGFFSKGSRNKEICKIFLFLGYDWIIQSYWQYRDNVSLHVFAKICVIVNLVVVTKIRRCFHRFVKWNMSPPACFKGLFCQFKMYLPGCRWVLWYFIEDCLPRASDRPLVQYFFLYILRTKTAVSVKQLHRFLKNLEVFYIQKVLI